MYHKYWWVLGHTHLLQLSSTPSPSEWGRTEHVWNGARVSIVSFIHCFTRPGTGMHIVSHLKAPSSLLCCLVEEPTCDHGRQ